MNEIIRKQIQSKNSYVLKRTFLYEDIDLDTLEIINETRNEINKNTEFKYSLSNDFVESMRAVLYMAKVNPKIKEDAFYSIGKSYHKLNGSYNSGSGASNPIKSRFEKLIKANTKKDFIDSLRHDIAILAENGIAVNYDQLFRHIQRFDKDKEKTINTLKKDFVLG